MFCCCPGCEHTAWAQGCLSAPFAFTVSFGEADIAWTRRNDANDPNRTWDLFLVLTQRGAISVLEAPHQSCSCISFIEWPALVDTNGRPPLSWRQQRRPHPSFGAYRSLGSRFWPLSECPWWGSGLLPRIRLRTAARPSSAC